MGRGGEGRRACGGGRRRGDEETRRKNQVGNLVLSFSTPGHIRPDHFSLMFKCFLCFVPPNVVFWRASSDWFLKLEPVWNSRRLPTDEQNEGSEKSNTEDVKRCVGDVVKVAESLLDEVMGSSDLCVQTEA